VADAPAEAMGPRWPHRTHYPRRHLQLVNSEGGPAPFRNLPPDAVRSGGRRGAGAPPSEASNLRIAPAKPALEAEHSCSRGHGNDFGNLLGDARDLVGSGHARIVEQALDGSAAQDVRLEDLLQIGFLHTRVPHVLGIHDDHGAVAALREAPRLVDADLRLLPGRDRAGAKGFDELLHVALLRTGLPRGADEHVAAILAHGRPRQRKNRWKTSSRDRSL